MKKRLIPVFEDVGRELFVKDPPNLRTVTPSEWKFAWVNREFLMKLKHKKKFYKQWKLDF